MTSRPHRRPEPDRATELENLRHQERMLAAVDRFLADGLDGAALLYRAADLDHARSALREHYGFDEEQTSAVLDLQVRRAPAEQRDRVGRELAEVRARLEELSPR